MKIKSNLIIILMLSLVVIFAGCSTNAEKNVTGDACLDSDTCELEYGNSPREINIDKLEVYHFHGTHQCSSCIAVGNLAEETVNTYFKDELEKGIIVFDHINADLPENRELVIKYGATGSSLWIGTYNKGEFKAEENTNVWYKINNKQDYMTYLKGIIEQKLGGE